MNKLTRAARQKLVVLSLAAALIVGALWQLEIIPQKDRLRSAQREFVQARESIATGKKQATLIENVKSDFDLHSRQLQLAEGKMASGDVYRWLNRMLRQYEQSNQVEIINVEPPRVEDLSILPVIPYQAATFTVTGKAHYECVEAFLSQLEDSFPHLRLQHLELEPSVFGDAASPEEEKLAFKVQLQVLVKPGAVSP